MHQLIHYNMGSKSAIGIGNGICFKQVRDKGGGSYIDPLVRNSIVGLWKFDQNTNESPTRNIIKNTIKDKGGDLELLNFGYKLNSGFGKYELDFNEFTTNTNINTVLIEKNKDTFYAETLVNSSTFLIYKTIQTNNTLTDTPSFKAKVEINKGTTLQYRYINSNGVQSFFNITEEGEHEFPISYNNRYVNSAGVATNGFVLNGKNTCRITQIPYFQGALVTDGKDDMIVSQKTVQEMGITDKITVVSMIHQIGIRSEYNRAFNNYICNQNVGFIRNNIAGVGIGKTGIYGYTWNNSTKSVINNILGDKNDYSIEVGNSVSIEGKFTVEGYIKNDSPDEISGVAVYWTFIANKVLTTDEINQIIGYYKLDKYVTPQVIYNVKRQGLTNDTPDSDWYLKDFSKNGFDMSLFNFAKKLGSGVGKYEVDFDSWIPQYNVATSTYTSNKLHVTNIKNGNAILYTRKATSVMKVKVTGSQSLDLVYRYITGDDTWGTFKFDGDGIYELPAGGTTTKTYYTGFSVLNYIGDCDITIEQIPDYEGALVSDGKDDYGQFVGDLGLKDYTIAVDRAYVEGLSSQVPIISSIGTTVNTPFLMEHMGIENILAPHSFGTYTALSTLNTDRFISYQSTYKYNGDNLTKGTSTDTGSGLTIGRIGGIANQYGKICLWSLMLFPYTLSEFLLERQLKRYKLGTLYPDMIEFRPIIKSNVDIDKYFFINKTTNKQLNIGNYFAITDTIEVQIYLTDRERQEIASLTVNGKEFTPTFTDTRYLYHIENFGELIGKKSPQKINIAINEYVRYEDIVQPYPTIFRLMDIDSNKEYTYGDKLKVGTKVKIASVKNLLPELYSPVGTGVYNGNTTVSGNVITVEKTMVFGWSRPFTYLKANEPNCIADPQRLRIPNSSYKILGYIPDISGHGNHLKINNSAYAGISGANGYVYNWNTWRISKSGITSTITDNSLHITSLKEQYNPNQALFEPNTVANTGDKSNFKVNITGLTSNIKCTFNNAGAIIKELVNGVNKISVDLVAGWYGFMITALDGSVIGDCDITIKQIGEYEGSFCLDGVDDFITIPTFASGAKQVLMKVNYKLQNSSCTIYDQRTPTGIDGGWVPTFCIYSNNQKIAYVDGNNGNTYIDGILNTSIESRQLANITHNITITNENTKFGNTQSPVIGKLHTSNTNYAQMALFTFMSFPEISSEDEIKELNDIVGIEGG